MRVTKTRNGLKVHAVSGTYVVMLGFDLPVVAMKEIDESRAAEDGEGPELDLIVPAIERAVGLVGLAPVMSCRDRAAAVARLL